MSVHEDDYDSAGGGDDDVSPVASSHAASSKGSAAYGAPEENEDERDVGWDQMALTEINEEVFEELVLDSNIVREVQSVWQAFQQAAGSRDAAGEAMYTSVFEAAPSLQKLFKTPRAVMAMRFMNGINQMVDAIGDPPRLKVTVETLGFQHLDFEVTVPRVAVFRDAILDLLQVELGARFTDWAQRGFASLLNYAGGAYSYIRVKYTGRIHILASSWRLATGKTGDEEEDEEEVAASSAELADLKDAGEVEQDNVVDDPGGEALTDMRGAANVPTTFHDMFIFNAAVMGHAKCTWMNEILQSFDSIVANISNTYRLQEECDVLSMRLAKYKRPIELAKYKAVMLASLRSLCRDWSPDHEVAWSWLWQNVERLLSAHADTLSELERSLDKLWSGLEDHQQQVLRTELFEKFFALTPAGQDYFKQSETRLHFIADRMVAYSIAMYKKPKDTVEELSGLGLRHVGYGIPVEMFPPFTTAAIQVVRTLTEDDSAVEAFSLSVNLISRILCRVITEGGTVVMRAINANSGKQLRKAIAGAPRGKRALWMLNVQVGTQCISPLFWAIETGGLDAAKAILQDLLTIRADRDQYYFGMGILFERHPDIVGRLCNDAPALLPTLLDGLVWRSRVTEHGLRRVNYYIKPLLVDGEGKFAKALEWLVEHDDPQLICHPVVVIVTDIVWGRLAFQTFLMGKVWLLFTLLVFVLAQAVMKHISGPEQLERTATFACRCFIYVFSLGQWVFHHVRNAYKDVKEKRFCELYVFRLPGYLQAWQEFASLLLTFFLIFMFAIEPILACLSHADGNFAGSGLFTQLCPQADGSRFMYSLFSSCAMLMYFSLLVDLAVFSTRLSAFALMIIRVLSEVGLFLFALGFFLLAFACASSTLEHGSQEFSGIPKSALSLLKVTFGMFDGESYDLLHDDEALLVSVFVYIIMTVVFLANLLIAQLNSAYQSTYQDMVGYARLNRGKTVVTCMPSISKRRWERVIDSIRLDEPCEFGEGDVGMPGGIQVMEPAGLNPTTVDMIRRYGGSTSTRARWPNEQTDPADEDRFARLEKIINKAMKRVTKRTKGSSGGQGSSHSASSGGSSMSRSEIGSE